MHHIVYMSRARFHFSKAALTELCELSRARNERNGVSGLLVCDGSRFIQALEGDIVSVHTIMNSIAADPRHDNISYIADRPLDKRQFAGWALEHVGVVDGKPFTNSVKKAVSCVTDPFIMAAFIGFASMSKL